MKSSAILSASGVVWLLWIGRRASDLWHNELPGEGRGLVTTTTVSGLSRSAPSFREKQRWEDAVRARA